MIISRIAVLLKMAFHACRYSMSCASWWHSQHRTFGQEVRSFSIGRGVGGGRNLDLEGGRGTGEGVPGEGSADAIDGEQDGDEGVPKGDGIDGNL
jgi:hypothetical protein